MGTFDRSKVSLNDKNNLIPEKDKFKLANSLNQQMTQLVFFSNIV